MNNIQGCSEAPRNKSCSHCRTAEILATAPPTNKMRLSAAQLAEYEREGVLVVEGVCPPDVCADAVRAIEQFVAKEVDDESRWYLFR